MITSTHNLKCWRHGVTLVELLVTMTILAVLSSAVLFASFAATEAAREANTRSRIGVMHSLLMDKHESFRTRRLNVKVQRGDKFAERRYGFINLVMKMEMPDRWSDVTGEGIAAAPGPVPQNRAGIYAVPGGYQIDRSALSHAYLRVYNQITSPDFKNRLSGQPNTGQNLTDNQGAECLYMIIMLGTGEGEAATFFRESDIGDVDGDGAREFLDAWGKPISFIRWAPGFTTLSDLQTGDPTNDHDPFDAFRGVKNAFRLVPLIYSAGPDGEYGIRNLKTVVTGIDKTAVYQAPDSDTDGELLGTISNPDTAIDNIHNHARGEQG